MITVYNVATVQGAIKRQLLIPILAHHLRRWDPRPLGINFELKFFPAHRSPTPSCSLLFLPFSSLNVPFD